jgi:mono/diheme cytochrome c family protein
MTPRALITASLAVFLAAIATIWDAPHFTVLAQASDTYRNVYDGWKWWHVYCFRCHGVNAVATTMAPNLLDPNLKLTPAQFLKIVRDGREAKGMQSWAKLLDAKQIGQIHLYVRARADKVLPPGRPDEIGPNKTAWVPPPGWPKR